MSSPNRSLYRVGWRLHKLMWRLTGGRAGARSVGMPVLQLNTIGRKSGEQRSVLLTYVDHPDGWVVIGSNLGSDRAPAWWLNLQADPHATVMIKGSTMNVVASELGDTERDDYWGKAVEMNERYADYPTFTNREIPVVLLRRA